MKARPEQIEAAARSGDFARPVFLLFGPDEAASAAQADALVKAMGEGAERVVLIGSDLRSDPARLADEASSLSLFGDRRIIRVDVNGDEGLAAVENLLALETCENPVVIVGTGMTDKGRIAKAVTAAKNALACMNYQPSARDMAMLVRRMADGAGIELAPDMVEAVAAGSGFDRRLAQGEIDKLALYLDAAPERRQQVKPEVFAALSAASDDADMGPVVNAVLSGDRAAIAHELQRIDELALSEVGLVLALQRRVMLLASLAPRVTGPGGASRLVDNERRIHFSEKPAVARQLERWNAAMLGHLNARLIELQAKIMFAGASARLLLKQQLLAIASADLPGRRG